MTTTMPVARRTLTWKRLAGLAAADLVLLLAQGIAHKDTDALLVAAALLVGVGLLRLRSGLAGLVLVSLSFANLVLWMLPAAISNAAHHAGVVGIALPATLSAVSLAGLVAALAAIARRRDPAAGGGTARRAGLAAVVAVLAALLVAAAVGPGAAEPTPAGGLVVEASGTAFHPATLVASGGQVTVHLTNRDLFWHSFTIDHPAVNVDVPVGGARQATFTLPPGTYRFYCRVPGHRQAGMEGTLRVG